MEASSGLGGSSSSPRASRGLAASGRRLMAGMSATAGAAEANPFRLPSDEEIFKLREAEAAKKADERARLRDAHVWEKLPADHRTGRLKRLTEEDIPIEDEAVKRQIQRAQRLVTSATAAMIRSKRKERETMGEFISKKREMFLLQMALDTKREEIQKLERKAQMKEEALKKSELMLEEDAIRFDAFLKENDREAYAALKQAEAETKEKQEKLQEIKQLKHALNSLTAEMTKLQDNLDECKRFKAFLESLTPREWIDERIAEKHARQRARRDARLAEQQRAWDELRRKTEIEVQEQVEAARKQALREGRQPRPVDIARRVESMIRPRPIEDDEPITSSGNDLPMYFTRPEQLLDKFAEKEESNLYLIGTNQDAEQQLEELRAQYRETEESLRVQTETLTANLDTLATQIADEDARAAEFAHRGSEASREKAQDELLARLGEKITEVYESCIGDTTSKPSRIGMLTKLEGRLEELLATIATFPEEYVIEKEKELELRRRKTRLEERKRLQEELQAQRLQISIARSAGPAKKKLGKPVMWRSQPPQRKKKVEKPDPAKLQELEDLKYLT